MKPIKLKQWLVSAVFLIGLALIVDHYYVHAIFPEKSSVVSLLAPTAEAQIVQDPTPAPAENPSETSATAQQPAAIDSNNNFQAVLAQCNPDAAALNLQSPEAYYEHYKKSVGVRKADTEIENYHLRLVDGSERRVQVLPSDNTNSNSLKEFRVFQLDAQGYPERLPLQTGETLQRVLAQGELFNKEWRERAEMNDNSLFMVEIHNNTIFEFQHAANGANTFSCRGKSCVCNGI